MDLREAVASRDRTEALRALADHLTDLLIDATPRDAASLANQLRGVLAALDAEPGEAVDPVDDLAARRKARRASAAGS